MVEKIDIEIGLEGGDEVVSQFRAIGEAIRATTISITKLGAALAVSGITLAATALVKFATAASETEQALTQLQKVSGQSFSNLSKLANVFSQGGTDLKKFASEFENLSEKIAAAGEQAAKQDAISKQAEDIAKGLKTTSLGAITLDERVKDLLETLSSVPPTEQWSKLADVFKNLGNTVERARIGKALGLSPESIATLGQGSEKIKELETEVDRLGLTLTTSNQQALQQMAQGWNQLTTVISAAAEKIGAIAAPAFEQLFATLKQIISSFIADLQTVGWGQAFANAGDQIAAVLGPAFDALFQALTPIVTALGNALGRAIVNGITASVQEGIDNIKRKWGGNIPLPGGAPIGGEGGGIGSHAAGGLIGGSGSGTSDSNLAWLSRGEFVINAAAVRRFGSGFFAALNAMRVPGFALGGLVPQSIPAFAAGGLNAGMSHVTIQFPGLPPIAGLRASADVIDQLHRAAALAQVRSGGRKPSRYS